MDETTDRADPQTSERTTSVSNGGSEQCDPGLLVDATQDPTGADARGCSTAGTSEGPSQGDLPAIGRYRIIRRLGQGAFGRVYLALDEDLGRPVAIKVPSPGRVTDPDDVAAYLTEARNLARLD